MLRIHYEASKDGFTFPSLLNLQTFEVFQGLSGPILNACIRVDIQLPEKYFEPPWKSGPA